MALSLSLGINMLLAYWIGRNRSQLPTGNTFAAAYVVPQVVDHKLQVTPLIMDEGIGQFESRTIDMPWNIAREIVDALPCDPKMQISDEFAGLLALTHQQRRDLQTSLDREIEALRAAERNTSSVFSDADGRKWVSIPPHVDATATARDRITADCIRILGRNAADIFCERLLDMGFFAIDNSTTEVTFTAETGARLVWHERKSIAGKLQSSTEYDGNDHITWRYQHLFDSIPQDSLSEHQ